MPPNDALVARFDVSVVEALTRPCRPRILIVTDGNLSYSPLQGFGLSRFVHAITLAGGVTTKPILTLAHRTQSAPPNLVLGPDTYAIKPLFDFTTANPAVTVANYDQLWLFGFDSGALPPTQVAVIAEFMNSGGGVFATGDHANLGQQLCGQLPRIRHMRDWSSIPMGIEALPGSLARIDTIVNPGADGVYEFDDQADDIPQRIYPHYKVTGTGFTNWQATVHPLLMRPGAPATRTNASGFTKDVDALPDHPHESVCLAVTDAAVLGGTYNVVSPSFDEFPAAVAGGGRVGAEIVASAVSGGRAINRNGYWKPPVTPRMFGVISAYDGRLATPYPGKTARPGRISCDSTWHHFVNVNLDGTQSDRGGAALGSGSGAGFVPSPSLEKIYDYYRNIISWLQPANRIRCRLWLELAEIRLHPALIEELVVAPRLTDWPQLVGLGQEAARVSRGGVDGEGFRDMLAACLLDEAKGGSLGDILQTRELSEHGIDETQLVFGLAGGLLAKVAELLPIHDDAQLLKVMRTGPRQIDSLLKTEAPRLFQMAVDHHLGRTEKVQRLSGGFAPLLKALTVRPG